MVAVGRALATYEENDPTFTATRECKLLHDLSDAMSKGASETFSDKLYQFDQMSKLDKWKTKILLVAKTKIDNQEDDFS